jgi:hypothetical protein
MCYNNTAYWHHQDGIRVPIESMHCNVRYISYPTIVNHWAIRLADIHVMCDTHYHWTTAKCIV